MPFPVNVYAHSYVPSSPSPSPSHSQQVGHDNWIRALVFHPSGKYLLSASDDKTIKVWDLANGRCTKTIEAHSHFVTSMTWGRAVGASGGIEKVNGDASSKEPRRINVLATGSVDQTIKVGSFSPLKTPNTQPPTGLDTLARFFLHPDISALYLCKKRIYRNTSRAFHLSPYPLSHIQSHVFGGFTTLSISRCNSINMSFLLYKPNLVDAQHPPSNNERHSLL